MSFYHPILQIPPSSAGLTIVANAAIATQETKHNHLPAIIWNLYYDAS